MVSKIEATLNPFALKSAHFFALSKTVKLKKYGTFDRPKSAERLRSVGIRRFELVARRHARHAVNMDVARRRFQSEGFEETGGYKTTVSCHSLVQCREFK